MSFNQIFLLARLNKIIQDKYRQILEVGIKTKVAEESSYHPISWLVLIIINRQ